MKTQRKIFLRSRNTLRQWQKRRIRKARRALLIMGATLAMIESGGYAIDFESVIK